MKSKILKLVLSSSTGIVIMALVILIPVLMILDFFGANITDGYVANNSQYASEYKEVLNKYVKAYKGYIPLERILYFALADESLTYDEIYNDNLDPVTKRMLPISEVCLIKKYKVLEVCKSDYLSTSGQVDIIQNKPFVPPINFSNSTITSYFMQERVVYGEEDIHYAWDFASSAQTPVYSVCDGTVKTVDFPYTTNSINTNDTQGGNIIIISCAINEDITYDVLYAHLYPKSSKVQVGNKVVKGQQLATVGTTGYSTGNHLHFQVSLNGTKIDGMSLIDFTYEKTNDFNINKPQYPTLNNSCVEN